MAFIIGRKLEMSQEFKEDGTVVPVTIVKAEPNTVTAIRTEETDGYSAVQVGTDETKKALTKPEAGHLKDLPTLRTLREFRVSETDLSRGDAVDVSTFEPGMKVDVVGTSKGRGFQGVVKRHNFGGSPASHGHKDQLRMPGSIGSQEQAPTAKGKRMAGHMGDSRVTVKNLEIVSVNTKEQTVSIKGAVPGARGGLLLIRSRDGKNIWQK